VALRAQKNIAEATLLLEQALFISPKDVAGHLVLGQCYEDLKRYTDAVQIYKRVLVLKPYREDIRKHLGVLEESLK